MQWTTQATYTFCTDHWGWGYKNPKGEVTAEVTNVKDGCMLLSPSLLEAEKLSSAVTLYFEPV